MFVQCCFVFNVMIVFIPVLLSESVRNCKKKTNCSFVLF